MTIPKPTDSDLLNDIANELEYWGGLDSRLTERLAKHILVSIVAELEKREREDRQAERWHEASAKQLAVDADLREARQRTLGRIFHVSGGKLLVLVALAGTLFGACTSPTTPTIPATVRQAQVEEWVGDYAARLGVDVAAVTFVHYTFPVEASFATSWVPCQSDHSTPSIFFYADWLEGATEFGLPDEREVRTKAAHEVCHVRFLDHLGCDGTYRKGVEERAKACAGKLVG